jgi:hypothetical protein
MLFINARTFRRIGKYMQVENVGMQVPNCDQSFGSRKIIDVSRMHAFIKTLENII